MKEAFVKDDDNGGDLKPQTSIPTRDEMTTAQFDEMMETGLRQAKNGEAYDVEDAFDKLEK